MITDLTSFKLESRNYGHVSNLDSQFFVPPILSPVILLRDHSCRTCVLPGSYPDWFDPPGHNFEPPFSIDFRNGFRSEIQSPNQAQHTSQHHAVRVQKSIEHTTRHLIRLWLILKPNLQPHSHPNSSNFATSRPHNYAYEFRPR